MILAANHMIGMLLATGAMLAFAGSAGAPAPFTFEQHDFAIGAGERQTVLAGFLLDGTMADIAVMRFDENQLPQLRLYALRADSWTAVAGWSLRPGVTWVDIVRIAGHDRLVAYGEGRLTWFDPATAREHDLLSVSSDFSAPVQGVIAHLDVSRDLNGDCRDDLTVPVADGMAIFIQSDDGDFTGPLKVGTPAPTDRVREAYGYRHDPWVAGRVHHVDFDLDGRKDLVFWNVGHFAVHLQGEDGQFASQAVNVTTEIEFDSDDLGSLAAPVGVRHRRLDHNPEGDLTGRVLHSVSDMNGDGVADLAVFSLEGGRLWHMHSRYLVHFGAVTPEGGTVFTPRAGAVIETKGIPNRFERHDFDQDGQVDMLFMSIKVGVFKSIGMLLNAVVTKSVSVTLEFHRMEEGIYPDEPNGKRKARTVDFGESGERAAFFPAVLVADVNGDGLRDLLVQNRRKELRIHAGVPGEELFARRPWKLAVAMPNEEYTWLVDLDADGRQDLIMHHTSAGEPNRLTLLLARQDSPIRVESEARAVEPGTLGLETSP